MLAHDAVVEHLTVGHGRRDRQRCLAREVGLGVHDLLRRHRHVVEGGIDRGLTPRIEQVVHEGSAEGVGRRQEVEQDRRHAHEPVDLAHGQVDLGLVALPTLLRGERVLPGELDATGVALDEGAEAEAGLVLGVVELWAQQLEVLVVERVHELVHQRRLGQEVDLGASDHQLVLVGVVEAEHAGAEHVDGDVHHVGARRQQTQGLQDEAVVLHLGPVLVGERVEEELLELRVVGEVHRARLEELEPALGLHARRQSCHLGFDGRSTGVRCGARADACALPRL